MLTLIVVGLLQIVLGCLAFAVAKSAIHEILAELLVGFGILSIALAAIGRMIDRRLAAIEKLLAAATKRLEPREPTVPPTDLTHGRDPPRLRL